MLGLWVNGPVQGQYRGNSSYHIFSKGGHIITFPNTSIDPFLLIPNEALKSVELEGEIQNKR